MKFNYGDMVSENIPGVGRVYHTPTGDAYPSITNVLGTTMPAEKAKALKNWQTSLGKVEADRRSKEAADSGTVVHLLAERYLKKEPLVQGETINPADMAKFNALKLKLNKVTEVWGQEVALCSHLLMVAGRCDLIGVYNGKPSIIDFKTSGKLKGKDQIEDYYVQLAAYGIMHNELFNTDIDDGVILMTSDGGFPQEFCIKLSDYTDTLIKRVDEFYAKLLKVA